MAEVRECHAHVRCLGALLTRRWDLSASSSQALDEAGFVVHFGHSLHPVCRSDRSGSAYGRDPDWKSGLVASRAAVQSRHHRVLRNTGYRLTLVNRFAITLFARRSDDQILTGNGGNL